MYPGFARGREQRIRALGTKPVRLGEAPVEMSEVAQAGQRRRLVDDRLRLGIDNGLAHGFGIEQVQYDRLRSERVQTLGPLG